MAGRRSLGRASRVASTVRVVYAMTPMEIRASILGLHKANTSLREISRLLKLSRNTVRRSLRQSPDQTELAVAALEPVLQQRLADAYARARGNAVRMGQLLAQEHGIEAPPDRPFN